MGAEGAGAGAGRGRGRGRGKDQEAEEEIGTEQKEEGGEREVLIQGGRRREAELAAGTPKIPGGGTGAGIEITDLGTT
jgi:hypothetical protein